MEFVEGILRMKPFLTMTIAIIVLFVGKHLNRRITVLRDFTIPEPVVD